MDIEIEKIVDWIKSCVNKANASGVVIGMSGGKDSLVVAKLCCLALGADKVFGIIMPNKVMTDKSVAATTCELLGLKYTTIDINNTYSSILNNIEPFITAQNKTITSVTTINTAPRIRMTTLYAIASSLNCLVANTSNLSETMVGYSTKWGDNVGDFAPLANFTKTEVCEIGLKLGLPKELVNKMPSDGLTGKTDEDNLGFSYASLDNFIRRGEKCADIDKILKKHKLSLHKINGVNKYINNYKNFLKDINE